MTFTDDNVATSTATFYVNGVSVGTVLGTQTQNPNTLGTQFALGRRVSTTAANGTVPWSGGVDELALYDTALTPVQIAAHYAAANTAVPEPASLGLLALGGLAALRRRRV
jgi:hypothetical protein